MIKKATDHTFEAFNSGLETETRQERVDTNSVPPFLLDEERISVYLTLAGLLDAGVDMDTALILFGTESKANKKKYNADRVSEFFTTARTAREIVKNRPETDAPHTDVIGEVAAKCFGRIFPSPEELVLLRGLAYTDNVPAILRAAADIIRNKTKASPARSGIHPVRRSSV